MSSKTEITILLDRSGSMNSVREATVRGINEFIVKVNEEPGEGYWNLIQFDDWDSARGAGEVFPHTTFENWPSHTLPNFGLQDYMPRGGTALDDAVCLTILKLKQRYSSLSEGAKPKVMFIIVTDGQENSSREYSPAKRRELIAEAQSTLGWTFIFLGADQDAFHEASKMGVATQAVRGMTSNKVQWEKTSGGVAAVYANVAMGARNWKADGNLTGEVLLGSATPDSGDKSLTDPGSSSAGTP